MTATERIAICPGSFDPITLGHQDIIERALRIVDRVVVAVSWNSSHVKQGMFTVEDRLTMIREVFSGEPRVEAAEFQGLLVDFARTRSADLVVRGLRGVRDFEYEFQMVQMNRTLDPTIETLFLAPAADVSHISSSLVREISRLGGDAASFVPEPVLRRLEERSRSA
ncbi:MAG: pantetheine-phosphate adenylyltransferase [Gemmatimonadota bacterium]